MSSSVAPAKAFSDDAIGNMLSKSDVGTYTYPAPGQPQPHPVMSISGSTVSATDTYADSGVRFLDVVATTVTTRFHIGHL